MSNPNLHLQLYRGTTAQNDAYTGYAGEITADTTLSNIRLHDGTKAGGTVIGGLPVGSIIPYAGTTIPDGWLLCDGSAISRTTYSALFANIGTTYGAGDGNSTFNIPNHIDEDTVIQSKTPTNADPSWYRIYESGWVEQGGIHSTNPQVHTFVIPMENDKYFISIDGTDSDYRDGTYAFAYDSVTANSFRTTNSYGSNVEFAEGRWEIKGQAKSGQYPVVKETKRQIIKY